MTITEAKFAGSCTRASQKPTRRLPEFAFIGRSNVGKSSLINMLCGNSKLAKTSSTPGKTKLINHFIINDSWYLVDLPGYGYAKVSENEKKKWGKMIENYLHTSKQLKAVFLLIDIRHEPSANDKMMYEWIVYQGYDPIIVATKLDKIKRSQIQKSVKTVREGLNVKPGTRIIPYSAVTKQGRDEIWELMDELVGYETEKNKSNEK